MDGVTVAFFNDTIRLASEVPAGLEAGGGHLVPLLGAGGALRQNNWPRSVARAPPTSSCSPERRITGG